MNKQEWETARERVRTIVGDLLGFMGWLKPKERRSEDGARLGVSAAVPPPCFGFDHASQRRVFCLPPERGIADLFGERGRVYFGRIVLIPASMIDGPGQVEIEERGLSDIQGWGADNSLVDGREVAPGEPIERYEAFDPNGDLLVLYRVPFRPKQERDTMGTA